METIEITAVTRKECSKRNNGLLRKQAQVPCVAYGKRLHYRLSVPMRLFRELVYTKYKCFIDLVLDGKKMRCILQDVQFHPVSNMILHADFLIVDEKKEIKMRIPVSYVGTPKGVAQGGRMVPHLRALSTMALPKNMPREVVVEVSSLKIGEKLRVRDISTKHYTFLDPTSSLLVSIDKPRVLKKEGSDVVQEEEAAEERAG